MAPAAAEVWPCPLQDLGTLLLHLERTLSNLTHSRSLPLLAGKAGAVWRKAAYASFEHRAEQLGLTADPAFSKLLASIGLQTNELDQLWQRQQVSSEGCCARTGSGSHDILNRLGTLVCAVASARNSLVGGRRV